MTRRKLDFYETGSAQVQALLDRVLLGSHILEPCVGWMLWGFTINPAIQVAAQKENQ